MTVTFALAVLTAMTSLLRKNLCGIVCSNIVGGLCISFILHHLLQMGHSSVDLGSCFIYLIVSTLTTLCGNLLSTTSCSQCLTILNIELIMRMQICIALYRLASKTGNCNDTNVGRTISALTISRAIPMAMQISEAELPGCAIMQIPRITIITDIARYITLFFSSISVLLGIFDILPRITTHFFYPVLRLPSE
jgi:hypothetical protein